MIQAGDPTGAGKGGQSIWAKPFEDEIRSTIKVRNEGQSPVPTSLGGVDTLHFFFLSAFTVDLTSPFSFPRYFLASQFNARGMVAMANSGPDTNKSQFFITYNKQPHLDGKYTIFGKVIDGVDSTLDAMERAPVNNKNHPLNEIKLTNVSPHGPQLHYASPLGKLLSHQYNLLR